MFSRQLPARSPIAASALPSLALHSLGLGADPRPRLLQILLERYRASSGILTASGTHALQLALRAATRDRQGCALLPAYSCYEVATAAVGARTPVALYDLDPGTLEPDWDSVRSAARHGASALVVAPLFGLPLDWNAAESMARELGVPLIVDAAQAFGSSWQDRPVASVGDLTVLSFGRGKGWTGGGGGALIGRGGAALTSSEPPLMVEAHNVTRESVHAAKAALQWLFGRPSLYGLPASVPALQLGETVYHDPSPPAGMPRTAAALVLASAVAADREVVHRRNSAAELSVAIRRSSAVIDVTGARMDDSSGALRYPLRVAGGWARLHATAAPRHGAAPGYPEPLRALPALAPWIANGDASIPGAETLARELVTLPTHAAVTAADRRALVGLLADLA